MKNIDFLPDIYRQRAAQSRARLWWVAVVAIFGAAIATTATLQVARRGFERRQLEALELECLAAESLTKQLLEVHAKTSEHAHSAALYTYLAHPWPRSQVLAAIVQPLPAAVQLNEVRLSEEELSQTTNLGQSPRPEITATTDAAAKLTAAQQDLEGLRERQLRRRVVLDISGLAEDVAELHRYVERISRSPLFAAAHMKSLATTGEEGSPGHHRFELQLVLSPGHGRAGEMESKSVAGAAVSPLSPWERVRVRVFPLASTTKPSPQPSPRGRWSKTDYGRESIVLLGALANEGANR